MEMENKTKVKGFVFPSSNKFTQMVVEKKIFLFPSSIKSNQMSEERVWMERVEIDTSAPFRSVKEAVDLFGGRGSWKPCQVEKKKKKNAEGACEPDPDRLVLTDLLNRADGFQTPARGMEKEDGSFLEKELDRTRAMLDRTKLMLQLTKDGESASPRTIVDENSEKGEAGSSPPVKTLEVAEKAVKLQVEEAKKVKIELLEKVEAAKVDIDTGRKALEEALLKVEEASRNCRYGRFDEGIPRRKRSVKCADSRKRRRRCIHKSTRFKNSSAISSSGTSAATTRMLVDGVGGGRKMVATTATSSATFTIGQILRMKLIGSEGMEIRSDDEPVSLREMLKRKF